MTDKLTDRERATLPAERVVKLDARQVRPMLNEIEQLERMMEGATINGR